MEKTKLVNIKELLSLMVEKEASDLHLTVGTPPQLRIDGKLLRLDYEDLTPDLTQQLTYSLLTDAQKKQFEQESELDFSFGIHHLSRFRANVFKQRGCVALSIRTIPYRIPSFEELNLPSVVDSFIQKPKGLILVTGPTGSGKSTTLAAMIDKININKSLHIITIEDPIEYLHHHKKCLINQREIQSDTKNFPTALKYVLRQDPDIILIGEMRDLETIEAALTISETGHLVLATLHTQDTIQSINRIVDVFPPYQQPQVRGQLSFVLEGILSQQLLPRYNAKGRVLALEVLVITPALRSLIREDKLHQVYSVMQTGQKFGMQTMNQSLYNLYSKRLISYEEAMSNTLRLDELRDMFTRGKEVI
ncbi:MAG: type IV pilus twitching motility protein PilT [bacterium]